MSIAELREQFHGRSSLLDIKNFLKERGLGHTGGYFHYTTLPNLKNMLKSGMLYLSLGHTMNDLRESMKCNQKKWKRLYVMSFSYGNNESMAMWNIYGNPLYEALRLEFSIANIKNLVSGDTLDVFQIIPEKENDTYELLCKTSNFKFVDIGYLHEKNASLRWNQSGVYKSTCSELANITSNEDFAGLVKNIAWEYEKETRLLVELPAALKKYPDKIAIKCKNLWKNVNILCSPCLDKKTLIKELQNFYKTPDKKNVCQLQLDDKHIVNSKNLWKVHFRHKCKDCEVSKKKNCLLQKKIKGTSKNSREPLKIHSGGLRPLGKVRKA